MTRPVKPTTVEIAEFDEFVKVEKAKEKIVHELARNYWQRIQLKLFSRKFLNNLAEFFINYKIETSRKNIMRMLGDDANLYEIKKKKVHKAFRDNIGEKDFLSSVKKAHKNNFQEVMEESRNFHAQSITKDPQYLKDISNPNWVRVKLLEEIKKFPTIKKKITKN